GKEVFLIKNNRIMIQPVEVGLSDSAHIAIVSGLSEGDIVVKDASKDITAGGRVKPLFQ
ncbi:MAG TPA: efflux transporter periplasmic adaptor subunit, partial [Syntrophomonas sp.]|nr:efflux transporter periplasmic adaptor subunit [Syntrophomonas sp.]